MFYFFNNSIPSINQSLMIDLKKVGLYRKKQSVSSFLFPIYFGVL